MADQPALRIARRYLISGRVQGVGFRYFTLTCAEREGVDGWARNTAEGKVEVEAEGSPGAMARFEKELHAGPRAGRVDRVDVTELPVTPTRHGFRIR